MIRSVRFSVMVVLGLFSTAAVGTKVHAQTPPLEGAPPPADTTATPPPTMPPPPPPPVTTAAPVKLESASTTIKFGLLLQPQYSAVSSPAAGVSGYAQNLYIRRTRILVGGTLFGVVDYFIDTDFPNLFLSNNVAGAMGAANTQPKTAPGMNIQDAFATYKAMGDMVKIDAGFMLPPMSHNAVQGATTLYGLDYFTNTFRHNGAAANGFIFNSTGNPVGRDLGVQLRGLVLDGKLEYRAGLFQGLRNAQTATDIGSRNFFRLTGRLQVNLLDPETGFFYAGTYLGAKKILSFGLSGDVQDTYKYFAIDGIVDMPIGPGVVTGQVNVAHWNGGTFIAALPAQTAVMAEAGFLLAAVPISPIVRYEHESGNVATTNVIGGGVGFWPYGHNTNVKLFYLRNTTNAPGGQGQNQINLQWQIYFF